MAAKGDGSASRDIYITNNCPPAMRKRDAWRIDQFSLCKKIGSGYASTVYLGSCRLSGNSVAIKMYHKSKLSELNYFQVNREIKIHSGLNHKNIIQLWASFEDQYGIYLVSEFAGAGDVFADVERRGGQLSESDTVRQIIHPFLCALIYMHERKIIHRDIKPENLLLTSAGILKVADFGLSINHEVEHPVTRVGTLDYMAPEVVTCPDKQKPRDHKENVKLRYTPVVDSWAVGVLAYELLVGRPPFDKGQKKATIEQILKGDPVIPSFISENASHFIKRSLTKDPLARPNVVELIEHPWVCSNMMPQLRLGPRGTGLSHSLGRSDSYVDTRSFGAAHDASSPDAVIQQLQTESVQQGGHMLMHSSSMSAVDTMRWRDLAFEVATGDSNGDVMSRFSLPKRKSDGTDELSLSQHSSAAGLALTFAAPGSPLAQRNSNLQPRTSSPVTPRTREEIIAGLKQPLSRSGSFSAIQLRSGLSVSSSTSTTPSAALAAAVAGAAAAAAGQAGGHSPQGSYDSSQFSRFLSKSSSVHARSPSASSVSTAPQSPSPLAGQSSEASLRDAVLQDLHKLRVHPSSPTPGSPGSRGGIRPQPPSGPRSPMASAELPSGLVRSPIQQPLQQQGLSRLGSFTQQQGRVLRPAEILPELLPSPTSPTVASPSILAFGYSHPLVPQSSFESPTSPFARKDIELKVPPSPWGGAEAASAIQMPVEALDGSSMKKLGKGFLKSMLG